MRERERGISNGELFWYKEWWGKRRVMEQKGEECRECCLRLLLIKNRQNLNPFAAQVSLSLSLSLNFVSMLWSNSITFSINSFSFGIGKNQKKKRKKKRAGHHCFFFFPFYQLKKKKHYRVYFFFILFSVSVTLFLCIPLSKLKRSLCLFDGAKGFCFLPRSWVLAQVFLNSEFGLWFSWTKFFYDILSNC